MEAIVMNTVIFEDKFHKDIKEFATTAEIDKFVAKQTSKESLDIILLDQTIVDKRGSIFEEMDIDIEAAFTEALNE